MSNICLKLKSLIVQCSPGGHFLFLQNFENIESSEYEAYYLNIDEIGNLIFFLEIHSLKYLKLDYRTFFHSRRRLNDVNGCIDTLCINFTDALSVDL